MALELRFALSIQDKNAGVSPKPASESARIIRRAVDERVAAREPMTAEIFLGELEAHWDWATSDIDTPATRRSAGS